MMKLLMVDSLSWLEVGTVLLTAPAELRVAMAKRGQLLLSSPHSQVVLRVEAPSGIEESLLQLRVCKLVE